MPKVVYGGQSYECGEGSILDCLTAHDVAVPSACRSGVCQTCMMRALKGNVPEKAKVGLQPTLAVQNYFLACSCYPQEDIEVALPELVRGKLEASVTRIEYLNADILGIRLKPARSFAYKAGQFINLFKEIGRAHV